MSKGARLESKIGDVLMFDAGLLILLAWEKLLKKKNWKLGRAW